MAVGFGIPVPALSLPSPAGSHPGLQSEKASLTPELQDLWAGTRARGPQELGGCDRWSTQELTTQVLGPQDYWGVPQT